MLTNDNYDESISELQGRLVQIDVAKAEEKIKNIDIAINKGKLDMRDLSQFESFYIHSKLHFFYHMAHPPIDKSNIISMHQEVIKLIPDHQDFDYLDQNRKV